MGAIFHVSFLTICAVLSQEMVVAFDDNLELSSVPHNRPKRMESAQPSIAHNDLPPLLAHNLRKVDVTNPSQVMITRNGASVGFGFAIHPYLVLTRRFYLGRPLNFGVSMYLKYAGIYEPQRVENHYYPDDTEISVVVKLIDPLLLDNPNPVAFAIYPNSVRLWANHVAEEWTRTELPKLHALLAQNLYVFHFDHPTTVQITSDGKPAGPGYAIHPYLVITLHHFIQHNFGVALREGNKGELRHYRLQTQYTNNHERIVVIQLLDPILLTQDAPGALHIVEYSHEAIAWAHGVAENWKHVMLGNPANCYHQNLV